MGSFTIDFFELAFLAEACIPPRPIARSMFWSNLTDAYWEKMTEGERRHLFDWMNKNWSYQESLKTEESTKIFHSRFDPENQYSVLVDHGGNQTAHRAFKYQDSYYVGTNRRIDELYIVGVEKFEPIFEY